MSDLIYVADDGQLVKCSSEGSGWTRLTHPLDGSVDEGWRTHRRTPGWSWPCPSPDGRSLVAFLRPTDPSASAQLRHLDSNGVEERQLLSLDGALPIYCQWSRDGKRVGTLVQDGQHMLLHGSDRLSLGGADEIECGAPLFFQWMSEGRVLVHVGDESGSARVLIRTLEHGEDRILGQSSGIISVPQIARGRIWLSLPSGKRTRFVCLDIDSEDVGENRELEGWFQWSPGPEGYSTALIGLDSRSRARGLGLWDWQKAEPRWLDTGPPVAAHWLPDGDRLLVVVHDELGFRWSEVDVHSGEIRVLCRFWPTPDEMMRIRFFGQFADSHPRISDDGRSLTYAGYTDPSEKGSEAGVAYVHQFDLMASETVPVALDRGTFSVYQPKVEDALC